MKYYSAIENEDKMNVEDKCKVLEDILSEVTQNQNRHAWYIISDLWALPKKLRIPMI